MNNSRSEVVESSSCDYIQEKPLFLKRNESEKDWNYGMDALNKRQYRREINDQRNFMIHATTMLTSKEMDFFDNCIDHSDRFGSILKKKTLDQFALDKSEALN